MKFSGLIIFLAAGILFAGCSTTKSNSMISDFRNCNENINIGSVKSDINGISSSAVEEQVRVLALGLINSTELNSKEEIQIEIKLNEKSYFADVSYLNSLFLTCSLYDKNNNLLASVSEYASGTDSFVCPETQERYLKNCLKKIKKLGL